jgi:iron complex outermembrane receptor protein
MFSAVIGKQQSGDYLPFIPANKLNVEIRTEKDKLLFMDNAYISFSTNTAFDQHNTAPEETPTGGYTLIDVGAGGQFKAGNQRIIIGISANNLLDRKYVDHLSTLKEVNLNNPGRNIILSVTLEFGYPVNK